MQATLIHRRDVIRAVRDRWLKQYEHYSDDHKVGWDKSDPSKMAGQIRKGLAALDLETCQRADIDAVLGVSRWAVNECDECQGDFPVVLRLGQEPDYETRWWDLCIGCLDKARETLARAKPHP